MHERSKFLVDPKVQWPLLGRYLAHWLLFLIYLVLIGMTVRVLFAANSSNISIAFDQAISTQWPTLCAMLVLLPVFLRDTMKFSNRFVGPIFRLRTELNRLANDQKGQKIVLRSNDFWREAAEDFGRVLAKIERLEAENEQLRQALSRPGTAEADSPIIAVPMTDAPISAPGSAATNP